MQSFLSNRFAPTKVESVIPPQQPSLVYVHHLLMIMHLKAFVGKERGFISFVLPDHAKGYTILPNALNRNPFITAIEDDTDWVLVHNPVPTPWLCFLAMKKPRTDALIDIHIDFVYPDYL